MTSFSTIQSCRSMNSQQSASILIIKQHRKPSHLCCATSSTINEEHQEISASAERIYDASTWRMYNRIVNSRKLKSQLASSSSKRKVGIDALTSAKRGSVASYRTMDVDPFSVPPFTSKLSKWVDRNRNRSSSNCSDTVASVREEEIFALDL
jgi:hypothetical protein